MRELNSTSMSPGQDPDTFLSRVYQLRDELENAGETVSEERLTDIVLEGLTSDYAMIKYNAECDPDISIQDIETTMRNMYANRVARKITSSKSYGRDSSMLVTSMPQHSSNQSSKFRGKCFRCGKIGHIIKECRSRRQFNSGDRAVKYCSLHHSNSHDDSECRNQLSNRDVSSNTDNNDNDHHHHRRNPRHRSNGSGSDNSNDGNDYNNRNNFDGNQRQANTATADPASTTAPYNDQVQETTRPTASTVTDTCSPPSGIGFSFLIDSPNTNNDRTPVSMPLKILIDSGCSNHMVDSQLLPNIEDEMLDYVRFDPPMNIVAAGGQLLHGTGKGVLHAMVTDLRGNQRSIRFPVITVPGLGRHLFSCGEAMKRGVSTIFSVNPHINVGEFQVPISNDGGTLHYLKMQVVRSSTTSKDKIGSALTTSVISGKEMGIGTAFSAATATATAAAVLEDVEPSTSVYIVGRFSSASRRKTKIGRGPSEDTKKSAGNSKHRYSRIRAATSTKTKSTDYREQKFRKRNTRFNFNRHNNHRSTRNIISPATWRATNVKKTRKQHPRQQPHQRNHPQQQQQQQHQSNQHQHHQAQQPQPTSSHQGSSNINLTSSREKADYIRELLGITGRANLFVCDPGHKDSDSSQQPVRASSQHKKRGETPRQLGSTTRRVDNFHQPGNLLQRKLTFYFKKQPPRATPSPSPRNASIIEKTASREAHPADLGTTRNIDSRPAACTTPSKSTEGHHDS